MGLSCLPVFPHFFLQKTPATMRAEFTHHAKTSLVWTRVCWIATTAWIQTFLQGSEQRWSPLLFEAFKGQHSITCLKVQDIYHRLVHCSSLVSPRHTSSFTVTHYVTWSHRLGKHSPPNAKLESWASKGCLSWAKVMQKPNHCLQITTIEFNTLNPNQANNMIP